MSSKVLGKVNSRCRELLHRKATSPLPANWCNFRISKLLWWTANGRYWSLFEQRSLYPYSTPHNMPQKYNFTACKTNKHRAGQGVLWRTPNRKFLITSFLIHRCWSIYWARRIQSASVPSNLFKIFLIISFFIPPTKIHFYRRGAQIQDARSPGQLNFERRSPIFWALILQLSARHRRIEFWCR